MTLLLTIYIPTFNRPQQLLRTLDGLLPQLREGIELVISDNCSTPPVADVLSPDILAKIRLIRNRYNVGGNENILRGFEASRAPWLWTLSDDDRISATAVEDILRSIAAYAPDPDVAILKFGDDNHRIPPFTMTSVEQLPPCVGNLVFMSSSVYRVENCLEAASVAHQYGYSMAPVLMTLLLAVMQKKKAVFIDILIAKWVKPAKENEWSFLAFSNAFLTLFEYPFPDQTRRHLYRILKAMPYSLKRLALIDLQHSYRKDPASKDTRFLVRCIYAKRMTLGSMRERAAIRLLKLLTCCEPMNAIAYRMLRRFNEDAHRLHSERT